ncbi:cell cycle checkpoint control protein RAD9A isoform X2 [Chelonia mydas]|uniref:cell cycle checkpoint control protein RAD9A isoform X2 n=1 Tax=Chelonia mydas TaxID=8469 RepID=UPI001CA7FA0A|nr:cell cycle checkpoint control protein RAD9A isoform X2 [Chelonia mydas]
MGRRPGGGGGLPRSGVRSGACAGREHPEEALSLQKPGRLLFGSCPASGGPGRPALRCGRWSSGSTEQGRGARPRDSHREGRALSVPHRRRALCRAHGGWALPACCELFPLSLRLLPVRPSLLPALRGRELGPRWGDLPLQGPHEVLPGCVPLAALAGEDSGEVSDFPEPPGQPAGCPAALQVRSHQDPQPVIPRVRVAAGRFQQGSVRQHAACPCPGAGGCCGPFSGDTGRGDAGGQPCWEEPSRIMVTELCLSEDEFQDVQVQQQSHVTFCLKEFRGLLSFAESSNLPLNIHFDSPGRPAIFTLSDPLLEVHLVLATLSDPNSSSQVRSTSLQAQPANGVFPLATADDFTADDIDSYMIAMETTCEEGPGLPSSPTFPQRRPHPGVALESESSAMESDLDGAVPGTPPQKKFRSLFFGSVLTQSQAGTHPGPSQDVLAEDSEGES